LLDFVGVKNGPAASLEEINKAYRKTSARIHPDKFKPSKTASRSQQAAERKKASERFARLGLIANILRGPERDRYDHFLKNGFPKWRGTGYYYARFRPGIGSVLVFIYLVTGAAHYVVLNLTAKRQREFMNTIIREARQAAFGAAGIPGIDKALEENVGAAATRRRERRAKKGGDSGSGGEGTPQNRRKVTQPSGKTFVVDPTGDVFLLNETEDGTEELLLDPSEIRGARWSDTLLVGLPRGVWNLTLGRFLGGKKAESEEEVEDEEVETSSPAAAAKPKKKGTPAKVARVGEGLPRRRTKGRAPGKAQ
jgi:curved DNA-binding protein CbpA